MWQTAHPSSFRQAVLLDSDDASCCLRANSRCCQQIRECAVIRLFAPHPCGSQSCHWKDRRQPLGHDVLGAGGSQGWGTKESPLRLLPKVSMCRQRAVDPAPPEALDSRKNRYLTDLEIDLLSSVVFPEDFSDRLG